MDNKFKINAALKSNYWEMAYRYVTAKYTIHMPIVIWKIVHWLWVGILFAGVFNLFHFMDSWLGVALSLIAVAVGIPKMLLAWEVYFAKRNERLRRRNKKSR